MAAHIFQNDNENSKQEIQATFAKAVELRALHASLLQGNRPASMRFPSSASPSFPCSSNRFSAQEYPVFMPSCEDETHRIQSENGRLSEIWDDIGQETGGEDNAADIYDNRKLSATWRNGWPTGLIGTEQNMWAEEDHKRNATSCTNHITVLQPSPDAEISKSSRRIELGEFKTVMTCNTCKPATISRETDVDDKKGSNSYHRVPVTDSHVLPRSHPKNKGPIFSWLFPRLKKKTKAEMSPNKAESESASQFLKEWKIFSVESLERQLLEANQNRDLALTEAAEVRSSLQELKQKLLHLEVYCEELKAALKQATHGRDAQVVERPNPLRREKSKDVGRNSLPINHEAMVEGFLQMVSEARLSVKRFCKTLIAQMDETDNCLMENLNSIFHPHNLDLYSKKSKGVLYHLQSLINQSFHQDFENCTFQINGPQKVLDPEEGRREMFSAFVALRNLSWNEVLRKGTKFYSEEFSRFCDQKMSCVVSTLNWSRPWPEQLLQSFFIAAKCIWLLHLLAFSFDPPLTILRVDENQTFDPHYMEDILSEKPRPRPTARVKIMVMPGFYINDKMLRCKVLCK